MSEEGSSDLTQDLNNSSGFSSEKTMSQNSSALYQNPGASVFIPGSLLNSSPDMNPKTEMGGYAKFIEKEAFYPQTYESIVQNGVTDKMSNGSSGLTAERKEENNFLDFKSKGMAILLGVIAGVLLGPLAYCILFIKGLNRNYFAASATLSFASWLLILLIIIH